FSGNPVLSKNAEHGASQCVAAQTSIDPNTWLGFREGDATQDLHLIPTCLLPMIMLVARDYVRHRRIQRQASATDAQQAQSSLNLASQQARPPAATGTMVADAGNTSQQQQQQQHTAMQIDSNAAPPSLNDVTTAAAAA